MPRKLSKDLLPRMLAELSPCRRISLDKVLEEPKDLPRSLDLYRLTAIAGVRGRHLFSVARASGVNADTL